MVVTEATVAAAAVDVVVGILVLCTGYGRTSHPERDIVHPPVAH